jgi:hypothetical protein
MFELAALYFILLLLVLTLSIYSAFSVDSITDILYPDGSTYIWGYFVGFVGVYGATIILLSTPILYVYNFISITVLPAVIIYFIAILITHTYMLRRRRWAWVIGVALHLNILSWIVNYRYVTKRWNYIEEHKYVNNSFKGKKKIRKR